jgi:transcriptional antiterminator NusG
VPNVIGFLGSEKAMVNPSIRPSEVNRILGKVDELAEKGEVSVPFISVNCDCYRWAIQ